MRRALTSPFVESHSPPHKVSKVFARSQLSEFDNSLHPLDIDLVGISLSVGAKSYYFVDRVDNEIKRWAVLQTDPETHALNSEAATSLVC